MYGLTLWLLRFLQIPSYGKSIQFLSNFSTSIPSALRSGDMNKGLVQFSNGWKPVGLLNAPLTKWYLTILSAIQITNWIVDNLFSIQMTFNYQALEKQTIKCLLYKWFRYLNVGYSDPYCIMVQIIHFINVIDNKLCFQQIHIHRLL